MNNCKNCSIQITNNIFCSKSCAATYNNSRRLPRSEESKQKTSSTIIRLMAAGSIPKPPKSKIKYAYPYTKLYGTTNCHHCDQLFWKTTYNKVCCSISCRDNIRSVNKCAKVRIEYFNPFDDEIVCLQSSWELSIAEWLTTNHIAWSRPKSRIKWFDSTLEKDRTYLPDFYIKTIEYYIDVKNPIKMLEDQDKIKQLVSVIPLYVGNIEQVKKHVAHLVGLEPTCIH